MLLWSRIEWQLHKQWCMHSFSPQRDEKKSGFTNLKNKNKIRLICMWKHLVVFFFFLLEKYLNEDSEKNVALSIKSGNNVALSIKSGNNVALCIKRAEWGGVGVERTLTLLTHIRTFRSDQGSQPHHTGVDMATAYTTIRGRTSCGSPSPRLFWL